ncbi:MAG: FeoB-associated Cys-rich membrane protein [Bacteroidota bacterium]|nr:FeoB-associated Cys-rich membrane protein [Bacteroidota bacterium]MDP3144317.1 FeoB-associated Cys-rich membrane protein [Bacteroidota bacterium]MDP3556303.1 FeoB-associated Cys-rich membrane protein [Bacteroidota bacterium]
MVQQFIVYSLLAIALVFLAFKFLKPKKKDNCDKDCNCG